jgi:hypothetical protein
MKMKNEVKNTIATSKPDIIQKMKRRQMGNGIMKKIG